MALKDSRDKLTREELREYDEKVAPKPEYVTAAQAQIMIDGILVDECYDIQYSYKEFKEPIYGYNSKYFDAILPGNVIVHGTFTINYKHDKYLFTLLKEIAETYNTTKVNAKEAIKYRDNIKELQKQYKQQLILYKQKREQKRELELIVRNASEGAKKQEEKLGVARNTRTQANAATQNKVNEAIANKGNWESELHSEDLEKTKEIQKQIKNIQDYYNQQLNILESERSLLSEQFEVKTKELAELDQKIAFQEKLIEMSRQQLKDLADRKLFLDGEVYAGRLKLIDSIKEKEKIEPEENKLNNQLITDRQLLVSLLTQRDSLFVDSGTNYSLPTLDIKIQEVSSTIQKLKTEEHNLIKELVDSDPQTKDAIKLDQEIAKALTEQEQVLVGLDEEIKKQEESLEIDNNIKTRYEDDLRTLNEEIENNIISKLNGLRDKIDFVNQRIMKLADEDNTGDVSSRAEDIGNHFSLYIMYNGNVHKILEGCSLTGHSHVIAQGGEAVREFYSFICRKIK